MKLVNGWVYVTVIKKVWVEGIPVPSPDNTPTEESHIRGLAASFVVKHAKTNEIPPGWKWENTRVNDQHDQVELYKWTW